MIYILALVVIHWIADFLCQTDWMAQNKSKEWYPLLVHTVTYSSVVVILFDVFLWYDFKEVYIPAVLLIKFFLLTLFFHTLTDYFTSRLNSKLWQEKKVHWFFVSVGFDQVLHYFQLFLTFKYLFT